MPIEIKELHIRITVDSANRQPPSGAGVVGSSSESGSGKEEKESIVAECLEQVIRILENKRER